MAKKLPVDFEQKVKQPPPANGKGYPYQLSAKDLMKNFKYLLELLPEGTASNDILRWDKTSAKFVINAAPAATGEFVLSVINGVMQWAANSSNSHPWKCTASGGSIVVSPGCVLGFIPDSVSLGDPNGDPFVADFVEFDGGTVAVSAATGFIYMKVPVTSSQASVAGPIPELGSDEVHSYIYRPNGTPTIYFSASSPSSLSPGDDYVHMPVASVAVSGGVASVTRQILTHNPVLQINVNQVYWGA